LLKFGLKVWADDRHLITQLLSVIPVSQTSPTSLDEQFLMASTVPTNSKHT